MPVLEIVLPLLKAEPQTVSWLKEVAPKLYQQFFKEKGLLSKFHGIVVEQNGKVVEPSAVTTVLALDWKEVSSFHAFYPSSDNFKRFAQEFKAFALGPPSISLYESTNLPNDCLASPITQIVRAKLPGESDEKWTALVKSLGSSSSSPIKTFYAKGIEKDEGIFLALFGWQSLQDYDRVTKERKFTETMQALSDGEQVETVVAKFLPIEDS